jgi:hypothetical protein
MGLLRGHSGIWHFPTQLHLPGHSGIWQPAHTRACHAAGAVNDWQKDLQFRKLNDQKDIIQVST